MPNYGLVVTPQYDPMSYEQYAKPFEDYAKVYNTMADAYDAMEMEANQWEKLADNAIDAPQYLQYKKYADDIRKAADDLATNGLNPRIRGQLSNLRKRYANEIKPIESAWTAREKEIAEIKSARLKDPDILVDRDPSNTPLSAYMAGTPEIKSYSGKLLQAYSSEAAKSLAKEVRQNPRKWNRILGGQYFETSEMTGLTDSEILATILGTEGASPALNTIKQQVLGMSGIQDWGNYDSISDSVNKYIENGYWSAIGDTKYSTLSNKDYVAPKGDSPTYIPSGVGHVEEWLFSPRERNLIDKFSKYFDDSGITNEGIKDLKKSNVYYPHVSGALASSKSSGTVTTDFYDAMFEEAQKLDSRMTEEKFDELIQAASGDEKDENTIIARKALSDLYDAVSNPNDVTGRRTYLYRYDSSTGDNIKDAVNRELGKSKLKLEVVEYDPITNTYKAVKSGPKSISSKSRVLSSNYSLAGAVIDVQDEDGDIITYRMPKGLDINAETNRDSFMQIAHRIAEELVQKGDTLSKADRAYYQSVFKTAVDNALLYHSQIGFVNSTKKQEFSVF